jgi:hypothetical protein
MSDEHQAAYSEKWRETGKSPVLLFIPSVPIIGMWPSMGPGNPVDRALSF